MIISKTPLRISFFSGGSDMPHFYEEETGAALSVTIDKFIYISLIQNHFGKTKTVYDEIEEVQDIDDMNHVITKETLRFFGVEDSFTITSMSDIPSKGSGLGSSSAFTVGLINAFSNIWLKNKYRFTPWELASRACIIEMDKCKFPIGKQDQFAAAYGGFNLFEFTKESVFLNPMTKVENISKLENNLMLVYSGRGRSSGDVLQKQKDCAQDIWKYISSGRNKAYQGKKFLEQEDYSSFGNLLHEAWIEKREITGITNDYFDFIYNSVYNAGALGGKLLGAGGGGFFLFYVESDQQEKVASEIFNLPECKILKFKFEYQGSRVTKLDTL